MRRYILKRTMRKEVVKCLFATALFIVIYYLIGILPDYLFFNTLLTTRTDDTSLLVEVNTSTFHT